MRMRMYPSGVSTAHSYAWVGGSNAPWNDAAAWRDLSAGTAAVTPPGSLDHASLIGAASPVVITGSGAAAAVNTYRSVLLDGLFAFATIDVEGTLAIAGIGCTLSLGNLGQTGAAVASCIEVIAASLTVAQTTVAGSMAAALGGWARLGTTATLFAGVTVDPSSCVQIGTGVDFWPSWLKIYADGTLSGSGAIAANTAVYGTILSSGLRFGGFLGGSGQVVMDASGASVGTVFAGTHLMFAAAGAVLSITPGSASSMSGTLQNFGAGDAIDLLGQTATSARYSAIDAQDGVLTVADANGSTLGRFLLAGSAASYALTTFMTVADGSGGTLVIDLPQTAPQRTSPGNTMPHRDLWIGTSGGAWNVAANWQDLTLGGVAVTAPGSLDHAALIGGANPLIVTGSGAATAVNSYRSVLLDGAFAFATLDVEGTLAIAGLGSTVSLGNLGQSGAAVASCIAVTAASLTVSGNTVAGSVSAALGGVVRLGASATLSAGVTVDPSSCVQIGSGGDFWPSWLKIYADGTLSGSGAIAANTAVYGTVLSSGLRFGGFLGGSGQVVMDASGASVGTVFQGTHLVFGVAGAVLSITPGSASSMSGTLQNFGAGDAIDLLGQTATSARYSAIDAQDGVLTVADANGSTLGRFLLAGSASSSALTICTTVADGSGGTLVIDLPQTTAPQGTSPGNATPHRESWIGGSGGAWNVAANWQDLTLGGVAVTAPGALDRAALIGGASPLLVTGSGAAAAVNTYRSVLLDGAFAFATIDVEGTLAIAGIGSTVSLGNLGQTGAAVASCIAVTAASLTVAGNTVAGSVSAALGSVVRLGTSATISAGVTVDAFSCVQIGTGSDFWPSWLKIYADGTLAGSGAIAANTAVYGTILSSGMRFGGFLGGSGQVVMDTSGASVGTVFAGTHLVFGAAGAVLGIAPGSASSMSGTLQNFGAGDAIDLLGQNAATARYTAIDAQDGILTVAGAGGAKIGRFPLAGPSAAYEAAGFGVLPDGAGGSLIVTSASVPSSLMAFTHPS